MIVIAGEARIKDDQRERAVEIAQKMSVASQAEEGCFTYKFYSNVEDPLTFFIFEVWETEHALEAHFKTPHMDEFRAALPDVLDGEMKVKRYNIESVHDA